MSLLRVYVRPALLIASNAMLMDLEIVIEIIVIQAMCNKQGQMNVHFASTSVPNVVLMILVSVWTVELHVLRMNKDCVLAVISDAKSALA